jgi:hypothetical protein
LTNVPNLVSSITAGQGISVTNPSGVGAAKVSIPNGGVTASMLASGAAVANIGYTPVNKAGDTMTGALYINGNTVWHAGNDGAGSGLDADMVDGLHANEILQFSAGNIVLASNSNMMNVIGWTTPTQLYSFHLGAGGTLRTSFGLYTTNSMQTIYGQIYRNGSPVGTQRSTTSTTAVTFNEDISGWKPGDYIQLYGWTTGNAYQCFIGNFTVSVAALLQTIS